MIQKNRAVSASENALLPAEADLLLYLQHLFVFLHPETFRSLKIVVLENEKSDRYFC